MTQKSTLRTLFWLALLAFLTWDYWASPKVDLRFEAPLIAAGSGQAAQGGHCSMPTGK
ncbi:hypothetical protein G7047_06305 [Diaphorobacter sp. HDW4A]|uniref:hypothetical protein n=1 Tax=Diaphorobacter sp. HDW4A TaxID=2714924 RepID=UPI00140765BC|nr:hypothetical protein [Diaphorobacter sp. HDW4A]QIL79557.1 hypothetical protein G7047_06305 [Diaphorobacter sp. HDW4A]